jgi:hypothetical protein
VGSAGYDPTFQCLKGKILPIELRPRDFTYH